MSNTAKKSLAQKAGTLFACRAPDARAVFVAGTFNDWNPTAAPLTRAENGDWAGALDLPPGRYEYKFVVDGRWCCAPGCEEPATGCPMCAPNGFGTMNRVLEVPA